ncbi:MAG: hypothetical protein ITG02_01075 [Patulibacter sp.]|nr:hypothetical protein [Patulibacter sp.]
MKRTTTDLHPHDLDERIRARIGEGRLDISRIARRANKKKTPERPTPEVAMWIAISAATCTRVRAVKHRVYLAEFLRYLLGIDATPPSHALKRDDATWIETVAQSLTESSKAAA